MGDVTQILRAIENGEPLATDELLPSVYVELRRMAAKRLEGENVGNTLQPTALVHEAYLRLVDSSDAKAWNSRGHFFCAAAKAMRRILIESARRKQSLKRGGNWNRLDVVLGAVSQPQSGKDLLALDEALTRLHDRDQRAARLVELRFFAGLTMQQAATTLDISLRTAERDWSFARAWLHKEVTGLPAAEA